MFVFLLFFLIYSEKNLFQKEADSSYCFIYDNI